MLILLHGAEDAYFEELRAKGLSRPKHNGGDTPRIVQLLRELSDALDDAGVSRLGINGSDDLYYLHDQIDDILRAWKQHENLSELRELLGVNARRRGAPRTEAAVKKERAIVWTIVCQACAGNDVSTFVKAAGFSGGLDEKQIGRAWKEWGSYKIWALRRARKSPDMKPVERKAAGKILKLLPK
jgi:hypothetical protein